MGADHTEAAQVREEATARRTLRLELEYDGAGFHGWQVQPGLRTVQGELTRALERVLGHSVRVQGASRTDAGVHARGQVASVDTTSALPVERIEGALRRWLAPDLSVCSVREAAPGFNARFDAIGKRYRYRLLVGRAPSALERHWAWHVRSSLDPAAMRQAAARLLGTHDFRSFARTSDPRPSVRTLRHFSITERGRIMRLDIEGDGFLYNMVRTIAGTLVEVGRGRREPAWVDEVLAARDRRAAGPTAPPQGLFLMRVFYPADRLTCEPSAAGASNDRARDRL